MKPTTYAVAVVFSLSFGCGDSDDGVPEMGALCFDGIDNDRNGVTDCDDPGCEFACVERNCQDGVDNDRDGKTDCDDEDCGRIEVCRCDDGLDNDANGRIDCGDNTCSASATCDAPDGMTPIFGGTFRQGCSSRSESRPVHDVTVPTFYMDRSPVTVEEYKVCIESGVCASPPTYEDYGFCTWGPHPDLKLAIRCVTWAQARKFCEWREMRLCSESEWEYVFKRDEKSLGVSALVVSGTMAGAEFVEDCWVSNYGKEHPDGTLELSVPTDGSAVTTGTCDRRAVKTVARYVDDTACIRGPLEPGKLYNDTFFRCCADADPM